MNTKSFGYLLLAILLLPEFCLALDDGLCQWEVRAPGRGNIHVTALMVTDPTKPPASGNVFLQARVVFTEIAGETPKTISKKGESLWFAQSKSQKTYVISEEEPGIWFLTVYNYLATKPGEMKKFLGKSDDAKCVMLSELTSEERSCNAKECMAKMNAKYFEGQIRADPNQASSAGAL